MATTPQCAPARTAPRLRQAAPHVSVVVINFCQWRNTDRVTQQLLNADAISSGTADVIVVDNDSPPDPVLARLRGTEGVSLKQFDRNTGFARAANEGCRLAGGEWVLLLNPDTAVPEGFLDQLEALCRSLDQEEPRAGVVGLSLRHADGSDQPSCGPPPDSCSHSDRPVSPAACSQVPHDSSHRPRPCSLGNGLRHVDSPLLLGRTRRVR